MQNPHYSELHNFNIEQQPAAPAGGVEQPTQLSLLNYLTLKIKFVLPIIFLLLMLPLTVIMFLLCVARPVNNIDSATGVLQTISYISESNPVVDIWPITGSQICDQDGYEPASLGFWRGTYQGCYCRDMGRYERRECWSSEVNDCINIPAEPAVETFTWNGDRFCLRRITDFTRTAGSCANGYRKCGDLLCVRSNEACPISDVDIIEQSAATPSGYTARSLTMNRKLVFRSLEGSNRQFVQLYYSTGDPCLDYNVFMTRSNGRVHILEKDHIAGCGEFGVDVETEPLDEITEEDFDELNNITSRTVGIPGYNSVIENSNVTLTARFRFQTIKTNQCAQYYISGILELVYNVDRFSYLYRGISISGVIFSFITFVIAIIYIKIIKRDGFEMVNRDEPYGKKLLLQIIFLHLSYAVVTTILGNIALSRVNPQETYLKEIADSNCFSDQTLLNTAVDDMVAYLTNKIDGLVLLNNIVAFFALGTTVAVMVNYMFRKSRNYDKSVPEQEQDPATI